MAWQLISLLWLDFELVQILYAIMTITLSLIYFAPNALLKNNRYRWLGDIIFFIPGIQLLF
jgi:cellulose synthase/poly-beta-1,6-N-acetylglucosamine synthase-like glycosyltransferase